MARSDPLRVLVAQLTGIASGYAVVKRCTRLEALEEIKQVLAAARRLQPSQRAQALNEAAAHYLNWDSPGVERWHPAALELLVEAGADLDVARGMPARSSTQLPTG